MLDQTNPTTNDLPFTSLVFIQVLVPKICMDVLYLMQLAIGNFSTIESPPISYLNLVSVSSNWFVWWHFASNYKNVNVNHTDASPWAKAHNESPLLYCLAPGLYKTVADSATCDLLLIASLFDHHCRFVTIGSMWQESLTDFYCIYS